ncbi:NAD-dependent protein deacetylase hst2 [Galdieria sulphuraria]|nr:NAD-dependent protein deacetylase hst2 [Galdieria sulphuraria]
MLPGQAYPVDGGIFAVEPKYDCEHINQLQLDDALFSEERLVGYFSGHCERCEEREENWVCLSCARLLCSRYINGHMKQHFTESEDGQHAVALSLLDLSLWCFICDSYVSFLESSLIQRFHRVKFGESLPVRSSNNEAGPSSLQSFTSGDDEAFVDKFDAALNLKEDNSSNFSETESTPLPDSISVPIKSGIESQSNKGATPLKLDSVESLADALKQGSFSNIVVLIGAGISTAADKYSLPHPTAVFDIQFFRRDPQPFYKVAKELMPMSLQPTLAHRFLVMLNERRMLRRIYTQNVDGLELTAGIPPCRLVQAHGSMSSAHCIECHAEVSIDKVKEAIKDDRIPVCEKCKGVVKPDIVFFGEGLPERFFTLSVNDLRVADLLLIIGTSLVVMPVAGLPEMANDQVPRVLMNMEPSGDIGERPNDLLLLGDCQETIKRLSTLCGWQNEMQRQKL